MACEKVDLQVNTKLGGSPMCSNMLIMCGGFHDTSIDPGSSWFMR
jgi:hypothetical protein